MDRGMLRRSSLSALCVSWLAGLLASAGMAAAQYPIASIDVEEDFRVIVHGAAPAALRSSVAIPLQPRRAQPSIYSPGSVSQSSGGVANICGDYTTRAGWQSPIELYLGEGAREHLATIKDAVAAWRQVFVRPVIILNEVESSYPLGANFPYEDSASAHYHDSASVIYFSPRGTSGRFGYVLSRQVTHEVQNFLIGEITEADIVVWEPSDASADLDLLFSIQHLIGHALGLRDSPILGNIMSSSYRAAIEEIAAPFVFLGLLPGYDDSNLLPGELGLFSDPQYSSLLRILVRPSEQDRLAMMCNYSFPLWGTLEYVR